MKDLLQYQKKEAPGKNQQRERTPVMFFIPMSQRIATNRKRKPDHTPFENRIMNNIYSK